MPLKKNLRKGGFLGSLINTGIVPGSILALQQTYKKKRTGGRKHSKKTRKHRRSHRRR
jgi:hypothetical protein